MKVIVDTCVWSLALRRNAANEEMAIVNILRELITDGRVVVLGAIRQDLCSSASSGLQYFDYG